MLDDCLMPWGGHSVFKGVGIKKLQTECIYIVFHVYLPV